MLSNAKSKPLFIFVSLFNQKFYIFIVLVYLCWIKLMVLFTFDGCNRWPFNDCFSSGWNFYFETLKKKCLKWQTFPFDRIFHRYFHWLYRISNSNSSQFIKDLLWFLLFSLPFLVFIIRNETHLLKWLEFFFYLCWYLIFASDSCELAAICGIA